MVQRPQRPAAALYRWRRRETGLGREPLSGPATKRMICTSSVGCGSFWLLAAGCVVGSPKSCSMESSFTLLGVARAAEKLGSGFVLVGLQPTDFDPWASTGTSRPAG